MNTKPVRNLPAHFEEDDEELHEHRLSHSEGAVFGDEPARLDRDAPRPMRDRK